VLAKLVNVDYNILAKNLHLQCVIATWLAVIATSVNKTLCVLQHPNICMIAKLFIVWLQLLVRFDYK
jgi:hypothetical protein